MMTDGPGHWTNEMLVFFLFLWFLSCYLLSRKCPNGSGGAILIVPSRTPSPGGWVLGWSRGCDVTVEKLTWTESPNCLVLNIIPL
jgi:hypothetical protein